jgi:serine/threonine protein kinase
MRQIAKGRFGQVFLVSTRDGDQRVLKKIGVSKLPAAERGAVKREAEIMEDLQKESAQPRIIRLHEAFWDSSKCHFCLVRSALENGSCTRGWHRAFRRCSSSHHLEIYAPCCIATHERNHTSNERKSLIATLALPFAVVSRWHTGTCRCRG